VASATRSPRARHRSMVSASSRTRPAYRARAGSNASGGGIGEGRRALPVVHAQAAPEAEARPVGHPAVDEVVDVLLQVREPSLLLRLRQASVLDGLVELVLRVLDERVLEPVDGLVLILGDLGQRLAALELALQPRLGQAEVARGRVEALVEEARPSGPAEAVAEAGAEARPAAEEREVVRLDPLLQRLALLLRQPAGRDGGIDAVLERLLDRGAQLAGLDAEVLCGVVDDRLALLARRVGDL